MLEKKEFDKAIEDYTQEIRLDPQRRLVYFCRGEAYAGKGEYDKAISDYTQQLRLDPDNLDPDNAQTYFMRGNAYALKDENDQAIADYTNSIKLDPYNNRAYLNRGITYHRKAIADYETAFRLNHYNIFAKKGLDQAIELGQIKQFPDDLDLLQFCPTHQD